MPTNRDTIERPFVSAKFLLAEKPSKLTTVVIPEGFMITKCPTRTASGAHRHLSSHQGDTKPIVTPKTIMHLGYAERGLRGYAATAKANVRA